MEVEAKVLQVTEVPSQGFRPVSKCKPSAGIMSHCPCYSHFILGPMKPGVPATSDKRSSCPETCAVEDPAQGFLEPQPPVLRQSQCDQWDGPAQSHALPLEFRPCSWTQGPHMSYPNGPELLLGPSQDSASGPSLTRDGQKAVICGRQKQGKTLGWRWGHMYA